MRYSWIKDCTQPVIVFIILLFFFLLVVGMVKIGLSESYYREQVLKQCSVFYVDLFQKKYGYSDKEICTNRDINNALNQFVDDFSFKNNPSS